MSIRARKIIPHIVLLLFLFSGAVKSLPGIITINSFLDITYLLFAIMLSVIAVSVAARRGWIIRIYPSDRLFRAAMHYVISLTVFMLLLGISQVAALSVGGGDTQKYLQVVVFTIVPIIFMSLIFTDLEDFRVFFTALAWFFLLYTGLVFVNSPADVSSGQAAFEGYQWRSRIAAFSFSLAICLIVAYHERPIAAQFLSIILVISAAILVVLGGGRQGLLGSAFVAIMFVFMSFPHTMKFRKKPLLRIAIWVLLLLFILPFAFGTIDFTHTRIDRLQNLVYLFKSGGAEYILEAAHRHHFYYDATGLFLESPLFGVGLGNYARSLQDFRFSHPHNMILETAAETGILGVTALAILIGALVKMIFEAFRFAGASGHSYTLLASISITVATLAMAMVSGDLGTNYLFFVFGFSTAKIIYLVSANSRVSRSGGLTY